MNVFNSDLTYCTFNEENKLSTFLKKNATDLFLEMFKVHLRYIGLFIIVVGSTLTKKTYIFRFWKSCIFTQTLIDSFPPFPL